MMGVAKNTVIKLLEDVGTACANYQDEKLRNLDCRIIQCDEIWSFCHSKKKNVAPEHEGILGYGDVWTWTAIEQETKLVPCWHVGHRDAQAAEQFITDLAGRLKNRVQVTTDGLKLYLEAIEGAFGCEVDYAMLIKLYGKDQDEGGIFGHTPPASTISARTIHKHKKRWGVSALALVHRLHKLAIIKEWQYRTLCIELSAAGYRRGEDEKPMPRDTSQVFDKVFKTLRAEGITRGAIARDLAITPAELDSLLVGLVIASLPNTQTDNFQSTRTLPPQEKTRLKAV
jgi:hypothetical protein